jgi:acyl-phosphate glycerol 3-phosphate acyltransferase
LLLIPAAYLYASLNWAILITRRTRGVDIRTLGTGNPGAANVGRNVGRGWGALVYFLDLSKSLLPLAAGRLWLFPGSGPWDYAALLATGIAAVAGHCRSVFHRFRGGGGIATSMGVYLFFVPVEFMASVLLGFAGASCLKSRVRFFMGQWTPILFVTLTPFLTLAFNWLRVPLRGRVSIGGHPWWVLAGTFLTSLFVLAMNWKFLARKLDRSAAI